LISTAEGKEEVMRKVGFLEPPPNQERELLDLANGFAYRYIME
jgi:hypothetical protein